MILIGNSSESGQFTPVFPPNPPDSLTDAEEIDFVMHCNTSAFSNGIIKY
jgi:hypothetical protein